MATIVGEACPVDVQCVVIDVANVAIVAASGYMEMSRGRCPRNLPNGLPGVAVVGFAKMGATTIPPTVVPEMGLGPPLSRALSRQCPSGNVRPAKSWPLTCKCSPNVDNDVVKPVLFNGFSLCSLAKSLARGVWAPAFARHFSHRKSAIFN